MCMHEQINAYYACMPNKQPKPYLKWTLQFALNLLCTDTWVPLVLNVATLGKASVPVDYAQSYPDSIKVCFWVSQLVWPISVKFGDRTVEEPVLV